MEPLHFQVNVIFYRRVHAHAKSISCFTVASDTQRFWTGDSGGTLKIWLNEDLSILKTIDSGKGRANSLCTCNENIWVGFYSCIQIRNNATGDVVHEIPNIVAIYLFYSNGKVWTVSNDRVLIIDENVSLIVNSF